MRQVWVAGWVIALAIAAGACRRDSAATKEGAEQESTARNQDIPEKWRLLGMPAQDLFTVTGETSADRFAADYRNCSREALATRVGAALVAAGYKQTCTQLDGQVLGYSKGSENLLVKVDALGSTTALTVANQNGADKLLYGVCFSGYELGPASSR